MRRDRIFDSTLIGTASIALAALFVWAGIRQLTGLETVAMQATMLDGFPAWMRVMVGIIEIVGAVGLLIPATSVFAALILAVVTIPSVVGQIIYGGGRIWLPLAILAGLLLVAWRRSPGVLHARWEQFARAPHPLLYDGVKAGILGAAVIAVWFLILDTIDGRPFFTPVTLGRGLVNILAPGEPAVSPVVLLLAYTVFHFAAFVVVGLVASLVVAAADREPSILFAFLLLFVVTEVGIYTLVAILDVATPLGAHAWLPIMVGNLIAIVTMGAFFWRGHRGLSERFRHALDREPGTVDELMAPPVLPPMVRRQ